jgi:thioredoxin-dependent peroxiredoxin
MLAPGSPAPLFAASDEYGNDVFLADYLGSWVLVYFYPKDDTPGCTAEACGLRDRWKDITEAGIVVFGVSADTVASHAKFKAKYQLPFSLLSDTDRVVVKAYGVGGGIIKRISYLIGPDGYIKKVYEKVQPAEHAAEILGDVFKMSPN